jgi:hypothetical protein
MSLYQQSGNPTNVDLNSVGSGYAAAFGHDTSLLIQKVTNKAIFDAAPQQFMDLKLLNMKPFLPVNSDEYFYQEMGWQRNAIASTGAVASAATQTIVIAGSEATNIAPDMIIVYPDNTKGIVTAVAPTGGGATTYDVTVSAFSGAANLPAVANADVFSLLSSVEGDGVDGFANYFRATTTEKTNYVQLFSRAIRYGQVELYKLRNAATTSNFLEMEKNAMFRQFRTDLSNAFWNGERGEVTTAGGEKAKTTGGIFPAMVAAGSANATGVTLANLQANFEDVVLASEYGDYGSVRFAYAHPKLILELSKVYKEQSTRYAPNDDVAKLALTEIDLGSSRIVLIPYARFGDSASFPASWKARLIILDHKNISLRQMWGERSGETLDRSGGIAKSYKEMFVDANMGVQFNNPLACAYLDTTGIV